MARMKEHTNRPTLPAEIARRRTFAIISHPDAGKTTLTEKFLLFGGAIQMAGQVRAKGEARRTRSDFMKMEQDRGISISASAMSFEFGNFRFNLVDTPGHSDFSEDTYRTLTAVDAAIMVIDGAKGVESQTRKLFEICRLRDLPILTFCNKMVHSLIHKKRIFNKDWRRIRPCKLKTSAQVKRKRLHKYRQVTRKGHSSK